jgi:hypothetical protein
MKSEVTRVQRRFERLSRLKDYKVDKHQVDPRGWNIVSTEGRTVGEVKDLLVDTTTMAGRYLDVELDTKHFDLHEDPHVLIPVEAASRDGDHRRLIVAGLDTARVHELYVERERHMHAFWDGWWHRDTTSTRIREAIETVRPGEQIRIPVENEKQVRVPVISEEIVVERRPVNEVR